MPRKTLPDPAWAEHFAALRERKAKAHKDFHGKTVPLAMRITESTYYDAVRGIRPQNDELIDKFCSVLDCSPREFLNREVHDSLTNSPHPAPKLPKEFIYRIGKIEIPISVLEFHAPPFHFKDVVISYEPLLYTSRKNFPVALEGVYDALIDPVMEERKKDGRPAFENNLLARLVGYEPSLESQNDKSQTLHLSFEQTTFLRHEAYHRNLDIPIIAVATKNKSIRKTYVCLPYTFVGSVLPNPLGTHTVLISKHKKEKPKVIIQRRDPRRVSSYKDWYQSSSAGFVNIMHSTESGINAGKPNPFVTALKESEQEVGSILEGVLETEDFLLTGLVAGWENLSLNATFCATTNLEDVKLLHSRRRDRDGIRESIAFDPHTVLTHIISQKWEPFSAFAMCAALIHEFGDQKVHQIADTLIEKLPGAFYEQKQPAH